MVLAEVSPKTQSKPNSLELKWVVAPMPVVPESASPLKDIPTIVDFARSVDKALGIVPASIPQHEPTERLYQFTGPDPVTGMPISMWAEHQNPTNIWHGTQPPSRPETLHQRMDKGADKIAAKLVKSPDARRNLGKAIKLTFRTGEGLVYTFSGLVACNVLTPTPDRNPDIHPTATGAVLQPTQTVEGTAFAPGMVDATAQFPQLQQNVSNRECAFPESLLSGSDLTLLKASMTDVQTALEQPQVQPGMFDSISCVIDMHQPQHKALVVLEKDGIEYLHQPEGFVPVKRLPLDDGSFMFVRLDLLPVLFPPPTQEPSATVPAAAKATTSPSPKPAESSATPPNTSEPPSPPPASNTPAKPPNTPPPPPPTGEGVSTPYPPPQTLIPPVGQPTAEASPDPLNPEDLSPNDGTRTRFEWTGDWYNNGQFIPGEPPGNYAEASDGVDLVVMGKVISVNGDKITIQLAPGNDNCNMNDRLGATCGTITLTIGEISIFDAVQRGDPPYEYRVTINVGEIHPNAWVSVRGNKERIRLRDPSTVVEVRLRQ